MGDTQKGEKLDFGIETASKLQIDEIDSYIGGLKKDLSVVKNGINHKYNNGLAERSVNKIKLTKRIMYGRNNFLPLKAKLLLNKCYYQINKLWKEPTKKASVSSFKIFL